MHERSLLKWSENRQSFTLHPLIQQTIQQYIVDQNNERQSVLSCLSETLIKLLPSLKEIQTRHKLTDANVTKYGSHLYHLASLILDCHCDSLVTQSAVDLACELSLQMQNLSVAETLCFGRLQTDRRRGNKKRLVQALVHTARVCALQHKACVAHLLCQSALQLLWERPAACGHTTEQWAFMMLEVAHAYDDLCNIAQLESVAVKTKGVLEAHGLTKCYVFAVSLYYLGTCLNEKRDFADAEKVSKESLSVYRRCVSEDHPSIGTELANLGAYCMNQRKFEESETFLQKSLQVKYRSLPAHHPRIVGSLRLMGNLYNRWGQFKKAEECLRKALDIIEDAYLMRHVETALVMSSMGHCYANKWKFTESEQYHRRGLKVTKDLLGYQHHQTAAQYDSLGICLLKQRKFEDAKNALCRAINIYETTFGRDHPDTAYSLAGLSFCYQVAGNYEKARPLFEEAVQILKRKYGENHEDVLPMVTRFELLKKVMLPFRICSII
jgi:tetratricopeptide (TPR) repeat protein